MHTCMDCGRLASQCDCEVMMTDLYGTEIVPGEEYIENQFDEAIHKDNAIRYLIDDGSHKLKTR